MSSLPVPATRAPHAAQAFIALYGLANIGLTPDRIYLNPDDGAVLVEVDDHHLTDWVKALALPAPTWEPYVGGVQEATWPEGTFDGRPFVLACTDYNAVGVDQ